MNYVGNTSLSRIKIMKISNDAKWIHRCVRSQSYEFLAQAVGTRMQRSQKALDTTISTTMGHKTSRKKSDESVLSLSEVTKYVVLTGSRRPSISDYCRTLASKMTINDALS